ncbi:hypothetical protein [Bacillus suaedaesalsae]|uniref:Uncharacterized protein n=1 Tax=Bacillus suaedaesalsae TaxID=2810349 RepID=A0ABS2DJQ4_9BACI|nr:hypothetical protein [Bacillus suaedaesalsae]MBM6617786.1 hypothetical protein [Bacillus suaedaesalsae]
MRKIGIFSIAVLISVFIFIAGYSEESDRNVKTIQTYLENEFTGPNDELINALEQESAYPPELQSYLEENYKPLVTDLDRLIRSNLVLIWLREATANGYQLKPLQIEIQKAESQNKAYDFEVKVEYSKDDQTNTEIITGRINIDDNGKIVSIRNMNGFELIEHMKK